MEGKEVYSVEQMLMILEKFKLTSDELIELAKEGEVVAFDDEDEWKRWMLQDYDKYELIDLIIDKDGKVDDSQIVRLDDGRVVFMYM